MAVVDLFPFLVPLYDRNTGPLINFLRSFAAVLNLIFVRRHKYCILKTRKYSIAKKTNRKVLNTNTLKHVISFTWQEP